MSALRSKILTALEQSDGCVEDPQGHADGLLRDRLRYTSPISTLRIYLVKLERSGDIHLVRTGWVCNRIVLGPNPSPPEPPRPASEITRDVLALNEQGMGLSEIARETRTPRSTVQNIVEGAGLKANAVYRKVSAEERLHVLELLAKGVPYASIAEQVGVALHTVNNVRSRAVGKGLLAQGPRTGPGAGTKSGRGPATYKVSWIVQATDEEGAWSYVPGEDEAPDEVAVDLGERGWMPIGRRDSPDHK